MNPENKRSKIFVNLIANGKVKNYLRVSLLRTGKFCIETARIKPENWELNVSMPLFDTRRKAENWLKKYYQEYKTEESA